MVFLNLSVYKFKMFWEIMILNSALQAVDTISFMKVWKFQNVFKLLDYALRQNGEKKAGDILSAIISSPIKFNDALLHETAWKVPKHNSSCHVVMHFWDTEVNSRHM